MFQAVAKANHAGQFAAAVPIGCAQSALVVQ